MRESHQLRCFRILLHGRLIWIGNAPALPTDTAQPAGFICNYFVLASNQEAAIEKAGARVRRNFDKKTRWLREGKVGLSLEVEEVSQASLLRSLWPANQGFVFYTDE